MSGTIDRRGATPPDLVKLLTMVGDEAPTSSPDGRQAYIHDPVATNENVRVLPAFVLVHPAPANNFGLRKVEGKGKLALVCLDETPPGAAANIDRTMEARHVGGGSGPGPAPTRSGGRRHRHLGRRRRRRDPLLLTICRPTGHRGRWKPSRASKRRDRSRCRACPRSRATSTSRQLLS